MIEDVLGVGRFHDRHRETDVSAGSAMNVVWRMIWPATLSPTVRTSVIDNAT